MALVDIVRALRTSRYFQHKTDIAGVLATLGNTLPGGMDDMSQAIAVGDDTAAIKDGDGYLLLAIEGLVSEFVREMPWFAGYSGVMVNISDIYAMGGRPTAVVNALWSDGTVNAEQVLKGMATASKIYGVPIVGGHTNTRANQGQLAVSILGRANKLLSSFNAKPGDRLLMAVDMRGKFEGIYPYWNASARAAPERLRADLEILPQLAESGLCDAAKDISMAGVLGTALMLLECSKVGAVINMNSLPTPPSVPILRWLSAFPSYGFLLSVRPENEAKVCEKFHERNLTCVSIGDVNNTNNVTLTSDGEDDAVLWNFLDSAFILPPELKLKTKTVAKSFLN
ncbi:sll0787 family AIR synthase-like protein [Methylotenera sp.]|uniref:sll0787 family AIR synthase-like protein n=1 Tax=Methylotenera sp. TaxID=2051956 RepID=UPI00248A3B35|nr:sll0787 family AIR synthase-like protein [Methylotenera sp.]MDI1360540.1 sll0787 family AIR synthase-like protein [Methylotenera sp.]